MQPKYSYILLSNDTGERLPLQDAPQGWDATKFRLIRDLTYLGILKTISVEFDFVGDGFFFMQRHRRTYGIDADVIIRVYRNNPNEFLFEGKVNMENYIEERKYNRFKVDIIQSGFVQKFQNREDVQLNLLNTLSLDRNTISPAAFHNATIRGRSIFFFSEYDGVSQTDKQTFSHTLPWLNKERGNPGANAQPYQVSVPDGTISNDEEEIKLINDLYNSAEGRLYRNNLVTPQLIRLKFNANFTIQYLGQPLPIFIQRIVDISEYGGYKLYFRLVVSTPQEDGTVTTEIKKEAVYLMGEQGNFNFSYDDTIEVLPGQSIITALEMHYLAIFYEEGDYQETIELDFMPITWMAVDVSTNMKIAITYNTMNLTMESDSDFPGTVVPVLLPHELFSNIVAQICEGEFYSEYFGRTDLGYAADGEGAYLAVTTGLLLRGIPIAEVQIPTSMRDAFSSFSSICCLGAMIRDNKEIRIEPLEKLFNNNIAAHIGEVNELTLSPIKEFLFNSVKAGYPLNEYEEQNGRDEFNTTYQYTNSLQAVKSELDLVSKYYGDGYGIEFARRESIINTGSKDSKFDKEIFFIDLIKDVEGNLMSRRQEGILFVDGIFSPETAINLRIAVGQNMLRNKKRLNIPLSKKEKVYFFQSKDKNTGLQLITELGTTIDGEDLQTGTAAYFLPEDRKFKCPITIETLFAILANPLGIVSYTYQDEKFFDFIYEVDAETDKAVAEWRMLGTKDTPILTVEGVQVGAFLKYADGLRDFVKYGDGENDIILYE